MRIGNICVIMTCLLRKLIHNVLFTQTNNCTKANCTIFQATNVTPFLELDTEASHGTSEIVYENVAGVIKLKSDDAGLCFYINRRKSVGKK